MTLSVSLQQTFPGFALDVEFQAPPGVTVLFGRSGSGKSTIINAIAGVLQPQQGLVAVDGWRLLDTTAGLSLPPNRRKLGVVFQEGRLFSHLTVRQNLHYGHWFNGRPMRPAEIDHVIEMLGIGALLNRRPGALSGGEKQRVAIGRALLASPKLILADEPLAALDEARKAEIMPYFERLRDETSVPILYVSHAPAEVARLATTVIALENGKIARQGPAIEVLGDPTVTPAGPRGAGAILMARIAEHFPDGLTEIAAGTARLTLPKVDQPVGSQIRVRIPAQDVMLSSKAPEGLSALNILQGKILRIRPGDGPGVIVSLQTPAGGVLARITRRSAERMALEPGAEIYAIIKTISIAPEDVGGAAQQAPNN